MNDQTTTNAVDAPSNTPPLTTRLTLEHLGLIAIILGLVIGWFNVSGQISSLDNRITTGLADTRDDVRRELDQRIGKLETDLVAANNKLDALDDTLLDIRTQLVEIRSGLTLQQALTPRKTGDDAGSH